MIEFTLHLIDVDIPRARMLGKIYTEAMMLYCAPKELHIGHDRQRNGVLLVLLPCDPRVVRDKLICHQTHGLHSIRSRCFGLAIKTNLIFSCQRKRVLLPTRCEKKRSFMVWKLIVATKGISIWTVLRTACLAWLQLPLQIKLIKCQISPLSNWYGKVIFKFLQGFYYCLLYDVLDHRFPFEELFR